MLNITCYTIWQTSSCPPRWALPLEVTQSPSRRLPLTAGSWGTEPGAWGRRRSDRPPLRPARSRTAAGSRCPTGGSSWGCWCPTPRRGPTCWAGSRRRRRTLRLWPQPATRKAWWRPGSPRNLQRGEGGMTTGCPLYSRCLISRVRKSLFPGLITHPGTWPELLSRRTGWRAHWLWGRPPPDQTAASEPSGLCGTGRAPGGTECDRSMPGLGPWPLLVRPRGQGRCERSTAERAGMNGKEKRQHSDNFLPQFKMTFKNIYNTKSWNLFDVNN